MQIKKPALDFKDLLLALIKVEFSILLYRAIFLNIHFLIQTDFKSLDYIHQIMTI